MRERLAVFINPILLKGDITSTFSIGIRQICSGAITTLVDLAVFQTLYLTSPFQLYVIISLSFVVAVFTNYAITSRYVFYHIKKFKLGAAKRIIVYFFVCFVSLAITQAVVHVLVGMVGFYPLFAKCVSIFVVFIWTLFASKTIVFCDINANF
ncbi:putative membrane protein [uncultured delta proteobacterium]|uniref:Putative membrane protein n=1 Tax=uncultured delta proteobacterium TaxID=34034 RepID=A0A212KH05_9DELT|nr:putative membrane protein [uncultured delta proteobacterium]